MFRQLTKNNNLHQRLNRFANQVLFARLTPIRTMSTNEKTPTKVFLSDYKAPTFLAPQVSLHFDIYDDKECIVKNKTTYVKNTKGNLLLNGAVKFAQMKLQSVNINGTPFDDFEKHMDEETLTIPEEKLGEQCEIEITTSVKPEENTSFQGLYKSNNKFFCTQMEAEGFRNMTYFQDRPDVMSQYKVEIIAPKEKYPWLLSNGNQVDAGDLEGGRHFVKWEDPWPKPCYLFAMVAGDLAVKESTYTKQIQNYGSKDVKLRIFVEHGKEDQVDHAMESLKRAFKWDEDTFGLEYDLDLFNIVAVSDFNMGAMENKSLNIFHTKYILANSKTGTDDDFLGVEGVVGHEYFHNYTGNRVTCRDWFQLTLKEGLTVFRDQEFTSEMNGRISNRVSDVAVVRAHQFREDAGPMRHPVRPASYIAMDNFYTATVYNKGAEVVRMYHTLLGRAGFRKGMDLYFQRHDGQAVTCEEFNAAMGDANGRDFKQFLTSWYCQSGTPTVTVEEKYDADAKEYSLTFTQNPLHAEESPKPYIIPVSVALFAKGEGRDGQQIELKLKGEAETSKDKVLCLTEKTHTFTFENVDGKPVPSLFRDFSAPVKVKFDQQTNDDLRFLMANDSDPFNRWDSAQTLLIRALLKRVESGPAPLEEDIIAALRKTLNDESVDPKLRSMVLSLPSLTTLGEELKEIDPIALYNARKAAVQHVADSLHDDFLKMYQELNKKVFDESNPTKDSASRALKNTCLSYLCKNTDGEKKSQGLNLAFEQFKNSKNMTDQYASLTIVVDSDDVAKREEALSDFYNQWQDEDLVMNKWFTCQSSSNQGDKRGDSLDVFKDLVQHDKWSIKSYAKASCVLNMFAFHQIAFHKEDGSSYDMFADWILKADAVNGMTAARLCKQLQHWKKYKAPWGEKMKSALEKVAAGAQSNDLKEVADMGLKV